MKKIWQKLQKAFSTQTVSKRFKVDFLMDGNLEPLHTTYLDGKSEDLVNDRFNSLDLESRRDIVSINMC